MKRQGKKGSRGRDSVVKLSTLISALLILVSIGTLGINFAWATVRIRDDPGGRIDKYLERFTKLRDSHEQIIVDGTCNSACTLLLGQYQVAEFALPNVLVSDSTRRGCSVTMEILCRAHHGRGCFGATTRQQFGIGSRGMAVSLVV
jgi:hypothetical protein